MKNPRKPVENPIVKKAPTIVNGEMLKGWRKGAAEQFLEDLQVKMPPKLLKLGISVIGSEKEFWKWCRRKPFSLGGERPMDLLSTKEGQKRIENLLGQIEHGIPP